MLIESSALYATWSIIFIGLYIVSHPMQSLFLGSLTDISVSHWASMTRNWNVLLNIVICR